MTTAQLAEKKKKDEIKAKCKQLAKFAASCDLAAREAASRVEETLTATPEQATKGIVDGSEAETCDDEGSKTLARLALPVVGTPELHGSTSAALIMTPTKRRRGRPRKYKGCDPSTPIKAEEYKRKRGGVC